MKRKHTFIVTYRDCFGDMHERFVDAWNPVDAKDAVRGYDRIIYQVRRACKAAHISI